MFSNKKEQVTRQGFTLVELSIVIIIIGFLIAGIAAGTSLIKQAELNSVVADFQNYQTAYNNFLGRYGQAPGDFTVGSSVWPNCGALESYCNGNGYIDSGSIEQLAAWRELSLAGMISAGVAIVNPDILSNLVLGVNVPSSKIEGAGYMMILGADGNASPSGIFSLFVSTGLWNNGKTNALFFGTPTGGYIDKGVLTAQEAFNLDKKLDDGNVSGTIFSGAQSGSVRVFEGSFNNLGDCLVGGNQTNGIGNNTYNIASTVSACVIGIALN